MSKGKTQGRREVFGQKPAPPIPVVATATAVAAPAVVIDAPSAAEPIAAPVEAVEAAESPHAEVALPAIVAEAVATESTNDLPEVVDVEPTVDVAVEALLPETSVVEPAHSLPWPPMAEVAPVEGPTVRRGHLRAKVLVHGLNATGYTLDGEQRSNWRKGDEGEFPKTSVDGIYLEAL